MNKATPLVAGLATVGVIAAVTLGARAAAQVRAPLMQVAQFDLQATGVAVVEDGRRFVNFPRWTDDAPISVADVLPQRLPQAVSRCKME